MVFEENRSIVWQQTTSLHDNDIYGQILYIAGSI